MGAKKLAKLDDLVAEKVAGIGCKNDLPLNIRLTIKPPPQLYQLNQWHIATAGAGQFQR